MRLIKVAGRHVIVFHLYMIFANLTNFFSVTKIRVGKDLCAIESPRHCFKIKRQFFSRHLRDPATFRY